MATGKKSAEAEAEPVSIRSKAALALAMAEIDFLLNRRRRSKAESDRLDQLGEAVRSYERKHFPVKPRSPGERLRYLLEIHETNVEELSVSTGVSKSLLQGLLDGTEKLPETDAATLADHFALEADAFR